MLFLVSPQIVFGQQSGRTNFEVAIASPKRTSTEQLMAEMFATDGQLYRNEEHHFHIKFPIGWEIRDGDTKGTIKKATKNDGTILVAVSDSSSSDVPASVREYFKPGEELDDLSDERVNDLLNATAIVFPDIFPGGSVLEKKVRYIDNRKAVYVKVNFPRVGVLLESYIMVHKGKMYQLLGTYSTKPSDWKKTAETIYASIATFKFDDRDEPAAIAYVPTSTLTPDESPVYSISEESEDALSFLNFFTLMMKVLFLAVGLYIFIGIVSYLVNSNKSFKDRWLFLEEDSLASYLLCWFPQ